MMLIMMMPFAVAHHVHDDHTCWPDTTNEWIRPMSNSGDLDSNVEVTMSHVHNIVTSAQYRGIIVVPAHHHSSPCISCAHNNQSCWTLSRAPGPCVALYCSPYSLPQPPTSSVHHPGYRACVGPVRLLRDSLT